MSERLVLLGSLIAASSGIPGLFVDRRSNVGQWLSVLLAVIASACGLIGVAVFWVTGISEPIVRPWAIPGGEFHVAMDALSALFLVPIFLSSLLGTIYGSGYWSQVEHPANGRKLRLFYGLLPAGMALLVIARNGILFLVGWEVMALSAYFLVTTEDDIAEVRTTGFLYLVATKFATVSLFALFSLLRHATGSFALVPINDDALTHGMTTAIFLFTVIGFGLKAGLMPFHVWLPGSHAIAPSHVSAIMSGVIIKMGIYGIVRVTSLVPHPPFEWGAILLGMGAVSGVLGIAFAIGQRDLKRLLAYSSIENIGIITMGIGLALLGRSTAHHDWVILGLGGALFHVWNHALFKGLLFLSAGSIIHGVETREIDQLGGLAKRMPFTATCFVIAALAVCGLPPLNGFASEFLIYLGFFKTLKADGGTVIAVASFAAPVLALIGALAVACFVKLFGIVFLGSARSDLARHAHESGMTMIGPMSLLAAICLAIGLVPMLIVPAVANATAAWMPELNDVNTRLLDLAPLNWISVMALLLVALVVLISMWLRLQLQNSVVELGPTWGCGFVRPTPRIQYTSSSFAELLVILFQWALRPRTRKPGIVGLFPHRTDFRSEVPDAVLDEVVLPTFRLVADKFSWFRIFQQGNIQVYLFYIFFALLALLLW